MSTMETWETTVETNIYLRKTDQRGREIPLSVGGRVGAKLVISTEDRVLNQDLVADAQWDPFTNGMLMPVRVSEEGLRNSNMLTRDDLVGLLAKSGASFKKAVSQIDSVVTLQRLHALAKDLDAKPSQMAVIEAALPPLPKITSADGVEDDKNLPQL